MKTVLMERADDLTMSIAAVGPRSQGPDQDYAHVNVSDAPPLIRRKTQGGEG
jgi:hypothetical protein